MFNTGLVFYRSHTRRECVAGRQLAEDNLRRQFQRHDDHILQFKILNFRMLRFIQVKFCLYYTPTSPSFSLPLSRLHPSTSSSKRHRHQCSGDTLTPSITHPHPKELDTLTPFPAFYQILILVYCKFLRFICTNFVNK